MSLEAVERLGSVGHAGLRGFVERLKASASESDTALMYDLLILGELITKLTTAAAIAAVVNDRDRVRYGLEYGLLRADSLGSWEASLSEVLTGPANALLHDEARAYVADITRNFLPSDVDSHWQRRAMEQLNEASQFVDVTLERLPDRASLRWWFAAFSRLRNRTRGHGALTAAKASAAVPPLAESLSLVADNLGFLNAPWMHLHQNLNGRFRLTPLSGDCSPYSYLKTEAGHRVEVGPVYVGFGADLSPSPLVWSEAGTDDVYLANGAFRPDESVEFLDYRNDDRRRLDRRNWVIPPDRLPKSETSAGLELDAVGRSFANIPPPRRGYVARSELESALYRLLTDDRHPVVTLVGRGGIGKTSLAIEVLNHLALSGDYFALIWFSARDIDLLPEGPKEVRPDVLTKEHVATAFVDLLADVPGKRSTKTDVQTWTEALSGGYSGERLLFVFDNFETVADPNELYQYIDQFIRLPNKVLITTRMREFKADYPVEVRGLTRSQFDELAASTAQSLGIRGELTEEYLDALFDETEGHPYLTKILLGDLATGVSPKGVRRLIGKKDDVLRALFERAFAALSPGAQRVFLTLCSWQSMVPVVALEAAILRPQNERLDVTSALDELMRFSLVELNEAPDGATFAHIPLSAFLFGQAKLRISPLKPAIELDSELLQRLGPVKGAEVAHGLLPRAKRLMRAVQEDRLRGLPTEDSEVVLKYMASGYPPIWLDMADMYLEEPLIDSGQAVECVNSYVQSCPDDVRGWKRLTELGKRFGEGPLELNAWIQLVELPESGLDEISDAAAAYARLRTSVDDRDVRRAMEVKLLDRLESHRDELDGRDFSRLAWLYVYSGRFAEASRAVTDGLTKDPASSHLNKLAEMPDVAAHL